MKIVIVGGSFAGFAALKLLKDVKNAEILLVSQSKKFWYNCAAPRLLVEPVLISDTVFDIKKYVEQKGAKFFHGKVVNIDFEEKQVKFENDEIEIYYDYLILATGTSSSMDAFKLGDCLDCADKTLNAIMELSREIEDSNDIVIIGGGTTGVETAGEIKYKYKEKNVSLYTGDVSPLASQSQKGGGGGGQAAETKLKQLGVKVVNNVLLERDYKPEPDSKHELIFNDGTSITADLFISTMGGKPLTNFLNSKYLDEKGFIKTDEYLRVTEGVIALGDVVSIGKQSLTDLTYSQLPVFKSTINHEIVSKKDSKLKAYNSGKTTLFVPIGKNGGIAIAYGIGLPSFMCKMTKCKNYFIPMAKQNVC